MQEIVRSISNLEGLDHIKKLVEKALKQKHPVNEIIEKGLKPGLDDVGGRYEKGEYFLSELLYAGEIMTGLFDVLKPHMKQGDIEQTGTILLGTVRGDMHDIGKNIFGMMAQFSGFKVHDIGVDANPERFVEETKKTGAGIVGMSTLLTSTLPEVKIVLDRLREAGIREKVKVIIGGNAVTKQFAQEVGVDAAALDVVEGVEICKKWATAK
ncbi:MAG: cobalamin-dependent protein [Candidatus Bathyarchaeota archaeon]|nr:cobalamin-dependent protein [Candidatus Bathyarchaeota archaeon]